MAYAAEVFVRLSFVPDGAGPMSVPTAQSIMVGYSGPTGGGTGANVPLQTMPGGNTASVSNLNTLATNIGTALQTAFAAVQPTVVNWSTGGQ